MSVLELSLDFMIAANILDEFELIIDKNVGKKYGEILVFEYEAGRYAPEKFCRYALMEQKAEGKIPPDVNAYHIVELTWINAKTNMIAFQPLIL
ncbi:hypothetical protein C0583_05600 [Candidatus Parcubacteria bacterium]|nr:MAG: hypothetical protein C0583_05600 [Candidatus Parcubacteria bacterium]